MNASGKLCPICKQENEDTASVCAHCGAQLESNATKFITAPESVGQAPAAAEQLESLIDVAAIPENGVGIYVADSARTFYVQIYHELIIGRPVDATLEAVLDLTNLNAANLGVSKRHAMLRRTTSGFEVIDLSSRNGTWLNNQRLVPNRPYPFASGSQVRLGKMQLLVMYHPRKG